MSQLPGIQLDPERHEPVLELLASHLRRHGYAESALHELYGQHIGYRDGSLFPAYFWRLGSANSALGQLALFWLQRVPQERSALEPLLGEGVIDALLEIGILTEQAGQVRSRLDLQPRGEQYIFTDHRWAEGADKVYHLGGDSYLLPLFGGYGRPKRLLDLCTGSGVQAIANGQAEELHLVDINPRAVQMARLNLVLNGLHDKSHVHLGDLWEPVESLTFDWISANPPFIPNPEISDLQLFQAGGASGEEITRTILQGAYKHLEVGGTLAIVTNAPERRGEDQIAKLRGWLSAQCPWGITHLVRHRVPRDQYIAAILDRNRIFSENAALEAERIYAAQFIEHLKHYERDHIDNMLEVVYLIEKLPASTAPWSIQLELGADVCSRDHNRFLAQWREILRTSHGPTPTRLGLGPQTAVSGQNLYVNHPLQGWKHHPYTGKESLQQLAVWGALALEG